MGIKGYQKWLKDQFGSIFYMPQHRSFTTDHLYIDANHILHIVLSRVQDKGKFLTAFRGALARIIEKIVVKKSITIAIDGVAPYAKIETQRERRKLYGKDIDLDRLSFLHLTPGTEYMELLQKNLDEFIAYHSKESKYKSIKYYNLGPTLPGEGEIKVIKRLQKNAKKSFGESHLIIGNDADLVIIASMANVNNVHIGIQRNGLTVMNIDKICQLHFRSVLNNEMGFRLKNDFGFLSLLLGNDYFPKMQAIKQEYIWEAYKASHYRYKYSLLNNKGVIDRNKLLYILTSLSHQVIKSYRKVDTKHIDPKNGLCRDYMKALYWCSLMYQTGECPEEQFIYHHKKAPKPCELMSYVLLGGDIEFDFNSTKPLPFKLCALVVLPKKARELVSNKYQKLIDGKLNFMYEEEECLKCNKLRGRMSTLKKTIDLIRRDEDEEDKVEQLTNQLKMVNQEFEKHNKKHNKDVSIPTILSKIKKYI